MTRIIDNPMDIEVLKSVVKSLTDQIMLHLDTAKSIETHEDFNTIEIKVEW